MVALVHRRHARPGLDHHARAFMAEDHGKESLGIGTRTGKFIGVADPGRLELDENFAGFRAVERNLGQLERFARLQRNSRAHLHGFLPLLRHINPRALCHALQAGVRKGDVSRSRGKVANERRIISNMAQKLLPSGAIGIAV